MAAQHRTAAEGVQAYVFCGDRVADREMRWAGGPGAGRCVRHRAAETVVIDTSNHYPELGRNIEAVGNEQWKACTTPSSWGGLWSSVAAGSEEPRQVAMRLVDDTGLNPFDAGALADP